MNIIPLYKLPLNTTATVDELLCKNEKRRRFLDLGLIRNTKITPILQSPSRRSACI